VTARLRAIAEETVAILDAGRYRSANGVDVHLAPDVAAAVAGTRLYPPDAELPRPSTVDKAGPTVDVTNETTLAATARLGEEVAALNFASAKTPGGGFLSGAEAQEESLARSSALYACLRAVPGYYGHHRRERDLRYTDRVVYSPAVPVFRDDHGALLDRPYPVTFLTAAAPNLGAVTRNQPEHAPTVPDVLRSRAARVLDVAAAHGHDRLVLGAWGCGVFRNDPEVVAAVFAEALSGDRRFSYVLFAVLDRQPGTPTYAAFARAFGSAEALDA
jgi:uncharacterized protein (TIGR02452 family)